MMNTNEAIHNRNAETAPRLRYADSALPNIVYPFNYPMQGLFYPINSPVIMASHHSNQPQSINANDQNNTSSSTSAGNSNDQSGIMSPNSDISISSQPPYKIVSWQEISENYEGNEEKPKCGKLKDNVYFTQRSASSDMYMVFDKKSDYINNFVNYYFSDKNLARDQKLVALMDEKGVVPLSALVKFPKLHQIDTTIEDLIKAFQCNSFVTAVDNIGNEKGAQRRDRLCAIDGNRNGLDINKSTIINDEIGLNNNQQQSVADINNMTMQNSDNTVCATQNTPVYIYNQAFVPTIFTQQPTGIMPTAAAAGVGGTTSQFNPYIMTPFPYPTTHHLPHHHHSQQNAVNSVTAINPNAGNHYIHQSPLTLWPVSSSDYNNHALISQMPFNHHHTNHQQQQHHHNVIHAAAAVNHNSNANAARFLSNSNYNAVVQTNNNNNTNSSTTTATATTTEPNAATVVGGNRIN